MTRGFFACGCDTATFNPKAMLGFLKRAFKVLAVLVGSLLLLLIVLVFWLHWDGDRRIERAKAMLREAGAPMSAAELYTVGIDADTNAYPLVENLQEFLQATRAVGEFWRDLNELSADGYYDSATLYTFEEDNEAIWGSVRELLQDPAFDTFFYKIERIVEMPALHPEWEQLERPIDGVLAVSTLRSASTIILVDAAVAAHFGDSGKAIVRIEQAAALSDLILHSGTIINALTASAMRSRALLAYEGLSRKFPKELYAAQIGWEDRYGDGWAAVLHTERLFFLSPISEVLLHGSEVDLERHFNLDYEYPDTSGDLMLGFSLGSVYDALKLLRSYPLRWLVKYIYADALVAMDEAVELAPLSYREMRQQYPEPAQGPQRGNPLLDLIPRMSTEAYILPRRTLEGADAHAGLARIAQALWRYKDRRGVFPDELAALYPEYLEQPLVDPFSGECFVYRRSGEGFALYSMGENQRDDGGVDREVYSSEDPKRDLIWAGYGSVLKRERIDN